MTDRTHPDSGRITGGVVEMLQARIADLEAQLSSIGAGGVTGPLIGQPQAMPDLSQLTERGAVAWAGVDAQGLREGFTAADMATAESRGFRDGVASVAASAGGEPVKPEDYVPLLDDEGRMMVGTSHHYTAENIRALVQQLRRFADPQQSTQADWDALDWRGWCNVLGRIVAALADEVPVTHPSPPEGMVMVPRKASVAIICAIEGEVDSQLTASAMEPGLMHRQDGSDIWDAAIAAAPPTAQAEGWRLIPVEPTGAMLTAAEMALYEARSTLGRYAAHKAAYRALLAAAPLPPTSAEGVGHAD